VRRAWPAYRSVSALAISIATLATLAARCGSANPSAPLPRDLIHELSAARLQPPDFIRVADTTVAGATVNGLVMRAPSRVTWTMRFPERAQVTGDVAFVPDAASATALSGVTVRIGVSDERTWEELLRVPASAAWQHVRVDLTPFSGWKWSLFYQPSRRDWRVVVNADATPGGTIVWRGMTVEAYRRP
jgi:hypothetical protein